MYGVLRIFLRKFLALDWWLVLPRRNIQRSIDMDREIEKEQGGMTMARAETNVGKLDTPKGALIRWKMTKENAPELYERMLKALDEQTEPKGNGKDLLKLSSGEHGYTITIKYEEGAVRFGEGNVVTIYKDNSMEIEMYDMWGRCYHVLIRKKEE